MSESKSNHNHSRYDAMTTEELERILQEDALRTDTDDVNTEMILSVMEVYAQRKKDEPHRSPEESYAQFCRKSRTDYSAQKLRAIRSGFGAVAAILVLVFVLFLPQKATGSESTKVVARWSNGEFTILGPIVTTGDVWERIEKCRPTWLPEGFEVIEKVVCNEVWRGVSEDTAYQKGEDFLHVSFVEITAGSVPTYYISDGTVEMHNRNGVDVYTFYNVDYLYAVWCDNGIRCDVGGGITMDELMKILDSINFG